MRYKLFVIILFSINLFASNYGELLFDGNCVTCHFHQEKKSAPSINEVRKNYLNAFPKEEDFVEYMSNWVKKPKKKSSLMHYAIDEFGLMPELGYDLFTLKEIAKYIYKTDFNKLRE